MRGYHLRVSRLCGGAIVARRRLAISRYSGALVRVVSERELRVHVPLRDIIHQFTRALT